MVVFTPLVGLFVTKDVMGISRPGRAIAGMMLFSCVSYSIVLLALLAARSPWRIARVYAGALRISPLRYVGKISYGLYLYHLPIFYYLECSHTQNRSVPLGTFLLALVLPFVVAALSYWLLESRLLAYKSRYDDVVNFFRRQPVPARATETTSNPPTTRPDGKDPEDP